MHVDIATDNCKHNSHVHNKTYKQLSSSMQLRGLRAGMCSIELYFLLRFEWSLIGARSRSTIHMIFLTCIIGPGLYYTLSCRMLIPSWGSSTTAFFIIIYYEQSERAKVRQFIVELI